MELYILIGIYLASGLVLSALARPLIDARVPRNHWYGFRVPKTLASDDVWYPANAFMGRDLLVCGRIITAGSLVLAAVGWAFNVGAVAIIGLLLTVVPLLVSLVRGFNYLKTL
jgi:uncharacterized membrane protein